MNNLSPTKSTLLLLREEKKAFSEAQRFLEEKRAVLANALVLRLQSYQRERLLFHKAYLLALDQLKQAVALQGGKNLAHLPAPSLEKLSLPATPETLLGVALTQVTWPTLDAAPDKLAPVVALTLEKFSELLPKALALAVQRRNLQALFAEYQKTERRSRALEEVLLPEMQTAMQRIEEQLEALDLEDAIRVRR